MPIDGIPDRAAQKIANGENANDAKQQAYREIRAHVLAQADQLAGVLEETLAEIQDMKNRGHIHAPDFHYQKP